VSDSYQFSAIDPSGRRLAGVEAASSEAALNLALAARGLLVLDVKPASTGSGSANAGLRSRGRDRREVLEVTRAMAALLPAGLPLARALATSSAMATGRVQAAIDQVRIRVERGESLAESLRQYSGLFPSIYVGLIRAGERSGDLAGAFARLATQLEREEQLRARLLSVSIYPLILASAGGIAILVLLFLVIPRFVELLQGTGATLPRSTAFLLTLSAALRQYWIALAAIPVALGVILAWMRQTPEGARSASRLLLSLPLIQLFRQQALAARFARLLGTLLGGGAPLLPALGDTAASIGDPVARDDLERVMSRVREGTPLHRALSEGSLFPGLLSQLVSVGEESGQLQRFLLKAADILEERTDRTLQRLVALVEPAMILVFGGIVGFVALSLLQAIYSVNAGSFR
jgi:type II secretory pathway component PulF